MGFFGMGVYQGYPYLEFRKPDFKHIRKKSCQDFPSFHICIRGVGEVYQLKEEEE